MLDTRWRKLLRDAWLHRSRSILVVLAIAVGIAGAGIVLNAWSLVDVATEQGYRASNPAAATLVTDSIDDDVLARVRKLPEISGAQARRTLVARVQTDGAWHTALLFVYVDFAALGIGTVKPEVGEWPPVDGSLAIERSSLDFAGASVGASVPMAFGGGAPVALEVSGIARDVGLAPGWMEHVVYGFVTRRTAVQLGAPSTLNELQITVRDKSLDQEAVRRLAYAVKAVVEQTGRRVANVDVPVPGEHIHAAQMDSLLLTQGAFGALALLLSGFLVVNLVAAMLAGQVREIGVMKAIGGRVGQIAAMYLVLAFVLGVVAIAIALPVANVLGVRYAALKADLLNFDVAGFGVPWWATALQVAAGVLIPVAAAAIPVVRGCRIPVSAALRDFGIAAPAGAGTSAIVLRAGGVARPILLSLRNAFRQRQRMILTLLSLSTGGAVFLGALNLNAAIRGAVDLLFAPQRYDVTVRLAERHQPDSVEGAVRSVEGIAAAEAWSGARAAVAHEDGTLGNSFAIGAPPGDSRLLAYSPRAGRWFNGRDGNVLVASTSWLAREPQFAVGTRVPLVIGGRTTSWTIIGVVDAGPSVSAFASRAAILDATRSTGTDLLVVRLSPTGTAARFAAIQRLRQELGDRGFPVSNTQLVVENRRVMEDHLLMVADFLGGMAWLMIVVGGLGLASTMSLSVLERTREIGVLRAIGARHGAILAMVQVEGLVIAVLSWLVALPLSIPMSVALGRAFGRVMLPVPDRFVPAPMGVVCWLALVLGVSAVACAWPALRAMRIPTRAALAYE